MYKLEKESGRYPCLKLRACVQKSQARKNPFPPAPGMSTEAGSNPEPRQEEPPKKNQKPSQGNNPLPLGSGSPNQVDSRISDCSDLNHSRRTRTMFEPMADGSFHLENSEKNLGGFYPEQLPVSNHHKQQKERKSGVSQPLGVPSLEPTPQFGILHGPPNAPRIIPACGARNLP